MKKWLKIALCGILALSVTGCGLGGNSDIDPEEVYGCSTLNVYNWGEYVGENTIRNFERQYNVKVNYSMYASNEEMYTKLLGGSQYDVLIPSDYMIERLIMEDMLQPLDKAMIPNMENLAEGVKGLSYDPENKYTAPYFWGSVGIIYDKTKVDQKDVESQGFDVLRNPKYKGRVFAYDSERDSFMMALKALGYSMNTEDDGEIQEAYEWLLDMVKQVDPAFVTDEVIDGMVVGEKDIAVVYSGDAAYMLSENEDLAYWLPMEGTNLWSDAMVIPANAKCPKLANEFINYILSDDASYDNSSTAGYASSNKNVLEEMTADGGEYDGNSAYLPRSGYEKDEIFEYNDVLKKKLADLWIKVKAAKK